MYILLLNDFFAMTITFLCVCLMCFADFETKSETSVINVKKVTEPEPRPFLIKRARIFIRIQKSGNIKLLDPDLFMPVQVVACILPCAS